MNGDGTVLLFTPKGRMLVDAPKRPEAPRGARPGMTAQGERTGGARAGRSASGLPPVPSVHRDAPAESSVTGLPPAPSAHPGTPAKGGGFVLSNGAALYRDSEIPWAIEAAAREAMEEFPD